MVRRHRSIVFLKPLLETKRQGKNRSEFFLQFLHVLDVMFSSDEPFISHFLL
jgi:hypothetical protein